MDKIPLPFVLTSPAGQSQSGAQSVELPALPEPNYFPILLGGLREGYMIKHRQAAARGDWPTSSYYKGRYDAIGECLEHYIQLRLEGLAEKS
jgi:hypothetical protein